MTLSTATITNFLLSCKVNQHSVSPITDVATISQPITFSNIVGQATIS